MTLCVALAFASPFLALLVALAGWWVAKCWWHPVADEQLHDSKHVWSRILPHVFVGGAVALGLLTVLYGGCGVFAHCCWESQFCGAAWKSPPWALVSGVAVAPALILLWHWRTVQRGKDQQQRDRELDQHERELKQQDQVALSSRFADAVRLLSGDGFNPLGGVYALEQVAIDAPEVYRSVVVKTLCAYVRSESSPGGLSEDVYQAVLAATRVRDTWELLDFSGASLGGANFAGADLRYTLFVDANLVGARFTGANLQASKLLRAKLSEAMLKSANLAGANLHMAHLQDADLRCSNLSVANLTAANLAGADLEGADDSGTKFARAKYDADTTPPDPSFDFKLHKMRRIAVPDDPKPHKDV